MSDYTKEKIKIVILSIVFVLSVYLQCIAQTIRSPKGLLLQLISLSLLLGILYLYNKRYK